MSHAPSELAAGPTVRGGDSWAASGTWTPDASSVDLWWVERADSDSDSGSDVDVEGMRARLAADRALLSPGERERADRQQASGHVGFATWRAALRRILARYGCGPPAVIGIEIGEHGRPALAQIPPEGPLDFNLSHSGRFAVVAVVRGGRVGVDVEVRRPGRDTAALAARFFAVEEQSALKRAVASGADPERCFYDTWVCKEAYLKALGSGIASGPRRFAVTGACDRRPSLVRSELEARDASRWRLSMPSAPSPEVAAAVCWCGEDRRVRRFIAPATGPGELRPA